LNYTRMTTILMNYAPQVKMVVYFVRIVECGFDSMATRPNCRTA